MIFTKHLVGDSIAMISGAQELSADSGILVCLAWPLNKAETLACGPAGIRA
jgi:hypothetical protein